MGGTAELISPLLFAGAFFMFLGKMIAIENKEEI
jgi:hypothetical protein